MSGTTYETAKRRWTAEKVTLSRQLLTLCVKLDMIYFKGGLAVKERRMKRKDYDNLLRKTLEKRDKFINDAGRRGYQVVGENNYLDLVHFCSLCKISIKDSEKFVEHAHAHLE